MLLTMHKRLILILLLASGYTTAGVYRWVDENGQPHFSDQPRSGAVQIELKETSIYTPPSAGENDTNPPTEPEQNKEEKAADAIDYTSIAVVSPENNQVVRSEGGALDISIELQPGLQPGHKIRVYLDGNPAAQDLDATQITLQNTDRGTHSLAVGVIDENNKELKRSSAVSFHMIRLAEPRTAPFEGKASES